MPRVALIHPYFRTRATTEILFAPLGVAVLAAHLQRRGIDARVFDCTFKTLEEVRDSLRDYRPDLVGIHCMITMTRNAFRLAEMVRSDHPESLLVAGGPLPTLYPQRFTRAFDAVFRGEADESFPRFCHDYLSLAANGRQLAQLPLDVYPGLFVRRGELRAENAPVHHAEVELETFPLPDRKDFDHAAYQQAGVLRDGARTASIMLTYGCPFDCDFCSRPVFGRLFRRRGMDSVMGEIRQIRGLGYDNLWIADDNFTLDPGFLAEFCRGMQGSGIGWSCLSRVTGITAETARMMKAAGCRKVYLGLESGSAETLKLMNKKATVEQGKDAVRTFHDAGIQTAAFFIVGYPGESTASIEQTFRLALDLPLDEISFNVPFPLPGSQLFQRVSDVDAEKDWDKENEVTFVYDTEFDEGWLRGRIEETRRLFAENRRLPGEAPLRG